MSGCCPGSQMQEFNKKVVKEEGKRESQLRQWPVQLHLVSPEAPYYKEADILISADCVAYTVADFHKDHLKDHSLAIACPKLDSNQEIYVEKIKNFMEVSDANTITVIIMQVPCCMGLVQIAKQALEKSSRKVPVKTIVVSLQGEILREEWL
ncbi:4Fe-4S ferredoxin [Alkalicella caledoniensis]|uniref:4Fe-4S ferredoxin n=1 Tax=Alkalicella caledoniensis TaxID=2731377 RepID=A0A7G9W9J8_ALKCA|nr:hypothetical protein [Alkalicella caledoniensis]QNO15360.1 4Fe-4S ferredoxin [Alkalicella caledoniensis]